MQPVLLWFRRNLRLTDNSALRAAVESRRPVIPIYIEDSQDRGGASRWWLHQSLTHLERDLRRLGSSLVVQKGRPERILAELASQTHARALYYARRYEPESRRQEEAIHAELEGALRIEAYDDSVLNAPETVKTLAGSPYRVFTAFWKAASGLGEAELPIPAPKLITTPVQLPESLSIDELGLQSICEERAGGYQRSWQPGESGGLQRLDDVVSVLSRYTTNRDRPDLDATSRLSPHVCFGEVSVRQVWHAIRQAETTAGTAAGGAAMRRQLFWRDFSSYTLFHFPGLPDKPLRPEFEAFPWSDDHSRLRAWQQGATGYPIVDAGMRQLLETGWMHNRVRMIVASFLVKDLFIPWQVGAEWFLDKLVDADLANNSASWQWVAGCGADAAPYFRIFNPELQARKFDPDGRYVGQWVPDAGESTYPDPIVDHSEARKLALEAYQFIKGIRTSNVAP